MKNVQSFNEFVNESEVINEASNWKKGDSVVHVHYGHDKYTDEMYDAAANALGCTVDDLAQFTSEDDDSKAYDAAEKSFNKGSQQDIKLDGQGIGGPFLVANKKAGICRYDDHGFTAFIYNHSKARF